MSGQHVPTVVKVGGSILADGPAYAHIARLLARRDEPWIAVVSAARGVTDRLLAQDVALLWDEHEALAGAPLPDSLRNEFDAAVRLAAQGHSARLLAWGEQASIAVLANYLTALDAPVALAELGTPLPSAPRLLVPGFYQRHGGEVVVLSRGSSDISAVDVAIQTGSREVQFWKDGGGIVAGGQTLALTDHTSLLHRIGDTIRPLHPEAVRRASAAGVRLRLEDPWCRHAGTLVA